MDAKVEKEEKAQAVPPMTLTESDLARILALAEKATVGRRAQVASVNCGDVYVKIPGAGHALFEKECDAAFDAALDPQTVIALVRMAQGGDTP